MTMQMYKRSTTPTPGNVKLPRPYIINGKLDNDGPVVLKLHYGAKYVIVKCKNEYAGLKSIEKALATYLRGNPVNPGNMYRFMFEWVQKHPDGRFTIKDALRTDNAYLLLKKEQQWLDEAGKDCLNWIRHAYLPEFNQETQCYGWITKNEYLNFMKWMASKKTQKKAPRK